MESIPAGKPRVTHLKAGALPAVQAAAHTAASADDHYLQTWSPLAGSADADLIPDLGTIVSRSRDVARNSGIAAGANQTYKDNIVGHVLRLVSKPDARLLGWEPERAAAWARETEAEFRTWSETTECDATQSMTLLGLTTQAMSAAFLNGEALAIPIWQGRPNGRWGTRLQMVEADRLSTPPGRESQENMRGGIEVDRYGAPVAYWIRRRHPGDRYQLWDYGPEAWERIPAFTPWGRRRVIHLHDKERTGQSRGKPALTAILKQFVLSGLYGTAELESAVSNSKIAAVIESGLPPESVAQLLGLSGVDGVESGSSTAQDSDASAFDIWNKQVEGFKSGGAFLSLPLGARINGFRPQRPNTAFEAFMATVLKHMAAGLNIPYELLLKDFTQTNYSSARAALLEAWRFFHGRRRWLMDYWLSPIYELWMEEAVNRAMIDAPDFYARRYGYLRSRWIFAGRGYVDPTKEAKGAQIRLDTAISTLETECAEQGLDWEEVLDQRKIERDAMAERGLLDQAEASALAPAETSPETQEAAA